MDLASEPSYPWPSFCAGDSFLSFSPERALKLFAADHQDEQRRPLYPLVLAYADRVDGTSISDRALSKLRRGDRGAAYAYEQLRRHGAPTREAGEADAAYVTRALREGPFRRLRHAGNHLYAFTIGSHASRKSLAAALCTGLPYPTATDPLPAPV